MTISKLRFILCLSLLLPGMLHAEDPVTFADPALKAAVEDALWLIDPTPTDMLGLTSLSAGSLGIEKLIGLEHARNLETLYLRLNYITDISPLSGLTELRYLVLHRNPVSDLSPLSGLTNLYHLNLDTTNISDISALSGLTNLSELDLFDNQVHDISPLLGLTSLTYLDLRLNPLDEEAYSAHIPQIIADHPGIRVKHNRGPFHLVFSSTAGGSIISPGEGEFISNDGRSIYVEAMADPGFVFAGFSGSYSTSANPFSFMPGGDHQIKANFLSALDILYVDDDAPGDSGPRDQMVSDPGEDGTREHPFDRIQEAIDMAADAAIVLVRAGTYRENINLLGKDILLTGFDPNDGNMPRWPVIVGGGTGPVVSFMQGEGPDCRLQGFVITGGRHDSATAIRCLASSPTVSNCLIVGNRASDADGAVVYCVDSNALFINCTMAGNHAGQRSAGLYSLNGRVVVSNSILWGNSPVEILSVGEAVVSIRYSDIRGGWPGEGNIAMDPLFADAGRWMDGRNSAVMADSEDPDALWIMGDYHLQSQAGRWDPDTSTWVQDKVTSPCIDAGDPVTPVGQEPSPNGGIINMGVFGGTAEASKSSFDRSSP